MPAPLKIRNREIFQTLTEEDVEGVMLNEVSQYVWQNENLEIRDKFLLLKNLNVDSTIRKRTKADLR